MLSSMVSDKSDGHADDIDRELARLLEEHRAAEEMDVRLHVKTCPHCYALSTLIGNLRRDLHNLAERRFR